MYSVSIEKKDFIPAFAGAGICLFFIKSGFLTLFFLVPLGFLAFRYTYRVAWLALLFAVLGNAVLAIGEAAARNVPLVSVFWEILYFSVMASVFIWIAAPPPALSLNVGLRFIIGCCLGGLLLIGVFYRAASSPHLAEYMDSLLYALVSAYRSSGSDVVQNALIESLTTERVFTLIKSIVLRGGGLVSCVLMFSICRQISLTLARVTLREKEPRPKGTSLVLFQVPNTAIWVLSASLLLVVVTRSMGFEIPEIILWNMLVLCAILYFAQGLGILQFFLGRPAVPPFLRLFLGVLFFVLLFSPGINAFLLAGVALLGIAENWVPFRAPKTDGPPSTPKAGDGDI